MASSALNLANSDLGWNQAVSPGCKAAKGPAVSAERAGAGAVPGGGRALGRGGNQATAELMRLVA